MNLKCNTPLVKKNIYILTIRPTILKGLVSVTGANSNGELPFFFFFLKVKIQPVAKYDWEHKYHYGRLIAVSNSFMAYAIRGESPRLFFFLKCQM